MNLRIGPSGDEWQHLRERKLVRGKEKRGASNLVESATHHMEGHKTQPVESKGREVVGSNRKLELTGREGDTLSRVSGHLRI